MTKLLVLGSVVAPVIAGGAYLRKRHLMRERDEAEAAADEELGTIPDADLIEEVIVVGITDIDTEIRDELDRGRE